jgi:hypothetical protein
MKNGMENDVKNGCCEHPGNGMIEKWSKNAFFSSGTVPKRAKMIIFQFPFCTSRGRVPSFNHFSIIPSFILKYNGIKMKWKMSEK